MPRKKKQAEDAQDESKVNELDAREKSLDEREQSLNEAQAKFEQDVQEFAAQLEVFEGEKEALTREQDALKQEFKAVEQLKSNILAEQNASNQKGDEEVNDAPKPPFLKHRVSGRFFTYSDALMKTGNFVPATEEEACGE